MNTPSFAQRLEAAWYLRRRWVYWLLPLEALFRLLVWIRRQLLQRFAQHTLPIPVVVVGNISVGGTGKTPLIVALVRHLQERGLKVGVISRGYGSAAPEYPYVISAVSTAGEAGDEPLSIWRATGCAVCIDADRLAAAHILHNAGCDILLSDDGLQHYRLGRALEIVVVDSARQFGNGHCLPVGPLREPPARLQQADFVVLNQTSVEGDEHFVEDSFNMRLQPVHWFGVKNLAQQPLDSLPRGTHVHAVAGIGPPQRFFDTLIGLGLTPQCHIYPDHHPFTARDFHFAGTHPVVMTSKDAVKCQAFALDDWLALEVSAVVDKRFWPAFDAAVDAALGPQQVFE
ncbi:MAG TPA: tetraacyldisaccharide 4'-kinase [Cellvibrionaceae bacterium]